MPSATKELKSLCDFALIQIYIATCGWWLPHRAAQI